MCLYDIPVTSLTGSRLSRSHSAWKKDTPLDRPRLDNPIEPSPEGRSFQCSTTGMLHPCSVPSLQDPGERLVGISGTLGRGA